MKHLTRTRRSLVLLAVALQHFQGAQGLGRGMLQADTVTYINTPTELLEALERGDPHIQILSHLDFTEFPPIPMGNGWNNSATLVARSTVRSIRGNCQEIMPTLEDLSLDASGPKLWPQKSGQCLLSGFSGSTGNSNIALYVGGQQGFPIWLDNVYVREGDLENGFLIALSRWGPSSSLSTAPSAWITNVTIQGNAQGQEVIGLELDGPTYVEDMLISHLASPGYEALSINQEGTAANLQNCEFFSISSDSAFISLGVEAGLSGVRLQNTQYTASIVYTHVFASFDSEVYADGSERVFRYNRNGEEGEFEEPKDISEASASTLQFISATDGLELFAVRLRAWWEVTSTRAEEEQAARERTPQAPPAGSKDLSVSVYDCSEGSTIAGCSSSDTTSKEGLSTAVIIAIAACCAAALAAVVLALVCFFTKKRANQKAGTTSMGPSATPTPPQQPYTAPPVLGAGSFMHPPGQQMPYPYPKNAYVTPFVQAQGHPTPYNPSANNSFQHNNVPPPPVGPAMHNGQHVHNGEPFTTAAYGYSQPPPGGFPMAFSSMGSAHGNNSLRMLPEASVDSSYASSMHGRQSLNIAQATTSSAGSGGNRKTTAGFPQVATKDSLAGTFIGQTLRPQNAPPTTASSDERQDYVNDQLDSLLNKEVLGGLIVLPGLKNRLIGGQAVVQIVEERNSRQDFAIKLFLSKVAFEQEKKLYVDPNLPLGRFLPNLRMVVDSPEGGFVDGRGNPMPPCIVMEKGEALDVWVKRGESGIDMVTGVQVLTHIAERLKDLHAAGYVHRDIKPGNIMWLPRQNRWTLIDFGCAAQNGEQAQLGFSVAYAAPEVIRAYQAGAKSMVVSEALDAWSVGVLAIELFTGMPAFDPFTPSDEVMAMIVGDKQAPWEDPATSDKILRKLGFFRRAVLPLLQRDPSMRPSMAVTERSCRSILSDAPTHVVG